MSDVDKHNKMPEEFVQRMEWKKKRRCQTCLGVGGGCDDCKSYGYYTFGTLPNDTVRR